MSDLAYHFEEGGWGMYPLVLCNVIAFALVLERACVLWRTRGPARALTRALELRLRAGDIGEAMSVAITTRGSCARVAARVLREALGPPERAEAARVEALANEHPRLRRNLRLLATVASLATLFGLLGTMTGVNVGFGCVANADAHSRATMLAKGLSEAMNCTAGGLFVSLVALAGYALLRRAIDARIDTLRVESLAVVNLLVAHRARLRWLDQRPYVEPTTYRA